MLTQPEFSALVAAHHKPDLAKGSMVYQVWEDGELTLQKGGDLLWQRTLHVDRMGSARKALPVEWFPCKNSSGSHGYIFTDRAGADIVHDAIVNPQ